MWCAWISADWQPVVSGKQKLTFVSPGVAHCVGEGLCIRYSDILIFADAQCAMSTFRKVLHA